MVIFCSPLIGVSYFGMFSTNPILSRSVLIQIISHRFSKNHHLNRLAPQFRRCQFLWRFSSPSSTGGRENTLAVEQLQNHREKEKQKTLQTPKKGLQRCFLASQRGFEPPAPRLGVAPIRHREVTSNAKKCLEIQGFSAFQILSDTTL